ncbi:MAG: hypothetical protein ABJF10_17195 [Chthoniobacter sp.]|uniref:hypothetical protein n=1 Tax=Chthoniobacter sp. TaxID=2510640 RepID=UPI0032AB894A
MSLAAFTCCPARAVGDFSEIKLGDQDQSGQVFDIRSEELATGEIQFHITAPDKKALSGKSPTIALSIVKITRGPDGFLTGESVSPVRPLEARHSGNSITCTFILTRKELDDPDLCFTYFIYAEAMVNGKIVPMASVSIRYARLQKLLNRAGD